MKGLGNDLVELDRIREIVAKHPKRFVERLFTQEEQEILKKFQDPIPHISGRFAAKEAVAKALGVGFSEELAMTDFWIFNNRRGKPEVYFSEKIQKKFNQPKIMISISHGKDYATAVAIWL